MTARPHDLYLDLKINSIYLNYENLTLKKSQDQTVPLSLLNVHVYIIRDESINSKKCLFHTFL